MRPRGRGERAGEDTGAAAVEFALILTPLLMMIGGLVDFGLAFNANISVTHAAHEGARLSAIDSSGDVTQRVIDTAEPTVTLTASNVSNPSCGEVHVSYDVETFFLSFIGIPSITVNGHGVEECYATPAP